MVNGQGTVPKHAEMARQARTQSAHELHTCWLLTVLVSQRAGAINVRVRQSRELLQALLSSDRLQVRWTDRLF